MLRSKVQNEDGQFRSKFSLLEIQPNVKAVNLQGAVTPIPSNPMYVTIVNYEEGQCQGDIYKVIHIIAGTCLAAPTTSEYFQCSKLLQVKPDDILYNFD